jgi:RND family efflux transporter MFP subunit
MGQAVLAMFALVILAVLDTPKVRGGDKTEPRRESRTSPANRGRLIVIFTTTGTLQPRELVDIGAQVVGRVIALGKDKNTSSGIVDWGSEVEGPVVDKDGKVVKQGTLLAQIDDELYKAKLESALAALKLAEMDLEFKTATMDQAFNDWNRAKKLFPLKGITQAEYEQYQAAHKTAVANVAVSKADIGLKKARLKEAQTNLDYTRITSPVKGVIIDRRVNVGQTVVPSLSAPSLFLIAKDLKKMEVWATVNEVDIGKIKVGQEVSLTVDAFPGRAFRGRVMPQGKYPLRLNAALNQNVVTYTVVVSVDDNEDGKLVPYLTAKLSFLEAEKKDVPKKNTRKGAGKLAPLDVQQLLVMPGAASSGSVLTLTPQDADAIAKECQAVKSAAPVVRARTQVAFAEKNWVPLFIYGTTPSFLDVRALRDLAEGEPFTDKDVRQGSRVCLIGQTIKRELFGDKSPVGREIRMGNVSFEVVGVLGERGTNLMGLDQDDIVLAPWTTIKARISNSNSSGNKKKVDAATTVNSLNQAYPGSQDSIYPAQDPLKAVDFAHLKRFTNIDQIVVRARSEKDVPLAIRQITDLLRQRHHIKAGQPDDFGIRDMLDLARALDALKKR